jgi:hypothetical protein
MRMIPDEQPKAASEPSDTAAPARAAAGGRRRSRRGGRRHSKRRVPGSPEGQPAAIAANETGDETVPVEASGSGELSQASQTISPAPISPPFKTERGEPPTQRSPAEPRERTPQGPRERQPEREQRRAPPERPPQPERPSESELEPAEFKAPSVTEAIEQVTKIIEELKSVLGEMEEVLETLEFAERQKIDDEREIETLQRALRQLRQHQPGSGQSRR